MEILVILLVTVLLFFGLRRLMRGQAQKMNSRIEENVTPENARIAVLQLDDDQHREVYRAIAAEDGRRALTLYRQFSGASIQDCLIAVQALNTYPQPLPSEIRLEEELGGGDAVAAADSASGTSADPRDEDPSRESLDEKPGEQPSADSAGSSEDEGESVEDMIDGVREDVGEDQGGLLAEADPNTGEILGENRSDVPDIPGGEQPAEMRPEDKDSGSEDPEDKASADKDPEGESPESRGQAGEPAADGDDVDEQARKLMEESGFSLDDELTIPEEWAREDGEMAGFHLEVQRGEETITLSHEDLEPWVHDQLYALLRDDHVAEAAQLLSEHSPLTAEEAHKFLVVFKNEG